MNLRELCKESNITCLTCSQSYKNYKSESENIWDLYCHGHFIWQDHVCLNWISKNEDNYDDDYISDEVRCEITYPHIRIDLSISEIERINNGGIIQTQYPWLTIGRVY